MPGQMEQTLLNRQAVQRGNADIAKLQELSRAQQTGGNPSLLQRIFAMLRPAQPAASVGPLVATEQQNMPDINLPNETPVMPSDPRLAEMADRKKYVGMRTYPPATYGQ